MSQSTLSKVAVGILAIVGIVCCIAGGVFYHKFPEMAKQKIEESLPLYNGSESAKLWVDSAVPVYWKVTFFNITNPDEVRENKKPILQEVGPFVFRNVKTKMGIEWRNDTVFYKDHRQYIHEPGLFPLDTEINHFNALYMAIIENMLSNALLQIHVANLILQNALDNKPNINLVETHTVWEILFGGFQSDLITELSKGEVADKNAKFFAKIIASQIKTKFPDHMFGLYYKKNDTIQHSYEMNTGKYDVHEIGKIVKYDNQETLGTTWGAGVNDSFCNLFNGTDATMFGPGVSKEHKLYAFTSELCRSVNFVYNKVVSIQDIEAYQFILNEKLFQVGEENADNACFCAKDLCKTGVLKISSKCPDGTGGIVFSAPHFYLGDKSLTEAVGGLAPDPKLHETYINVEPNTGVVIGAAKRLQINVHVRKLELPLLQNAEERIMPIAWLEESAEIDAPTAKKFRSRVTDNLYMYPKLLIALTAVGGFFVILSSIICIYKR